MIDCQALVYSRKLKEDFHFLAIPEGFSDEDKKWIKTSCINPSLVSLTDGDLKEPIFKTFENDKYYIMSVSTTGQLLRESAVNQVIPEEKVRDTYGRLIYGFFAYVVNKDGKKLQNNELKSLYIYSNLYKYVLEGWETEKKIRYSDIHSVPELSYLKSTTIPQLDDDLLVQFLAVLIGFFCGLFLSSFWKLEIFPSVVLISLTSLLSWLLRTVWKTQTGKNHDV